MNEQMQIIFVKGHKQATFEVPESNQTDGALTDFIKAMLADVKDIFEKVGK